MPSIISIYVILLPCDKHTYKRFIDFAFYVSLIIFMFMIMLLQLRDFLYSLDYLPSFQQEAAGLTQILKDPTKTQNVLLYTLSSVSTN